MKSIPHDLRELARHLDTVTKNNRSHGGAGFTYDEEVKLLRAVAVRLERYESLLKTAANNANDSGEEDSFEDAALNALL